MSDTAAVHTLLWLNKTYINICTTKKIIKIEIVQILE